MSGGSEVRDNDMMQATAYTALNAIPAEDWNALAGTNPFLQYEFLAALEITGCVGPSTGWEPSYLTVHAGPDQRLVGAAPLYVKQHSYGEYVFDWGWAEAYERSGRPYYPKLVVAVPFTPAAGRRLLIATDVDQQATAAVLLAGSREIADQIGASSSHWLFPTADEMGIFTAHGLLARTGCQFHWSNPGYRDFDDYLSAFTSHQRNNIRRERRRVREAGVHLEVLTGRDIGSALWDVVYRFYRSTIRAHGGIAYLTREFFHRLGDTMPDHVVVVAAKRGRDYVGAAFGLRDAETFYGRYWGGRPDIAGLHFETCYYTPIEYCIAAGMRRYEAGAQGEHKLARGFVPTPTYSAHWVRDTGLRRAVADFLKREQEHIGQYMSELNEHSPLRPDSARLRV